LRHCSGFAHRNAASVRKIPQTLAGASVNRKELIPPAERITVRGSLFKVHPTWDPAVIRPEDTHAPVPTQQAKPDDLMKVDAPIMFALRGLNSRSFKEFNFHLTRDFRTIRCKPDQLAINGSECRTDSNSVWPPAAALVIIGTRRMLGKRHYRAETLLSCASSPISSVV
jgi:hypothetical protein